MSTVLANHSSDTSTNIHASSIIAWIVIFSASLYFFYEFLQINLFNALAADLIRQFHISSTELGHLSASYMYANVIFLFPAGMILDRFSVRRIILIAMLISVACTFFFSISQNVWEANLCRFVTGIAGSFSFLSCVRLASRWFPPKRLALVIGMIVTIAMVGAVVAQTPFTILTDDFGWRRALQVDAIAGVVILILIACLVRDFPPGKETHFNHEIKRLNKIGFWKAIWSVLLNVQNWLAGIYASLINLPIFLLGATWGSFYLVQARHLSRNDASYVTSMIFLGMVIGSPVVGWLSDRLRRRKLPMLLGALASLTLILLIMYLPTLSLTTLLILFFALGFVIASQILAYPLVAESNPANLTGTAEGLASVLIMAGGFMIPFFPYLLNLYWNHQFNHGVPIYSANNFQLALMIMPLAFIIALLGSLLLKETHCQTIEVSDTKEN